MRGTGQPQAKKKPSKSISEKSPKAKKTGGIVEVIKQ
jgi:hypothetical protein